MRTFALCTRVYPVQAVEGGYRRTAAFALNDVDGADLVIDSPGEAGWWALVLREADSASFVSWIGDLPRPLPGLKGPPYAC